jgi:hypothetical protein
VPTLIGADQAGLVTLTTGTGTLTAGPLAVVTFAHPWAAAPFVVLEEQDSVTRAIQLYATSTVNGFTIGGVNPAAASTTYHFAYHVIGGA